MGTKKQIKLIECPRDAMQGWHSIIPTQKKIEYINALLKVGFDTIDFGSFVSAKAIPQMADTADVVKALRLQQSKSKLLAIVANVRGAEDAVQYDQISYLGFPFSISPTFQLRNTNSSIEASFKTVEAIQELCIKNKKQLVIYISMGFGNPYGDEYSEEIVMQRVDKIVCGGVNIVSIADTVGLATPEQISTIVQPLIKKYSSTEIGVHLHSSAVNWQQKADAALVAGCVRFDGAIKGIGGCPMAGDELVGNMDTTLMIPYFKQLNRLDDIDEVELAHCIQLASAIFV